MESKPIKEEDITKKTTPIIRFTPEKVMEFLELLNSRSDE
ncbi:MAG: hypothetical protein BAJALOKI3v1_400027 [Promethearchaeota archaeon]|jgi:hypothetical protein|nr:MAG: hypothetical protein BAJALOKI3v1_400027 [Candidatus Lokiarchaeota archaeon]